MTQIDESKPVLVTGGGGYIASWVVKYLLEKGCTVRATVRDKSNTKKTGHLTSLPGAERLELVEADLLDASTFRAPMDGCELVIHLASPFFVAGIKDPQKQLVDPAVQGTRAVLETANEVSSVKRIVLTSSVASVMGDNADARKVKDGVLNEEHWNESSSLSHQPYPYSKVQAEKAAWEIAGAQSRWDLVVINPSFVLGPSLSKRLDSTSTDFVKGMVDGRYPAVLDLTMGVVDVRDVAQAHVLAGFTPGAKGRNLITARMMSMMDMANALREKFGKSMKIPGMVMPKFLGYIVGPFFGQSWKWVDLNVGVPFELDNGKGIRELGIKYRPAEETLVQAVEQLIESGAVKVKG